MCWDNRIEGVLNTENNRLWRENERKIIDAATALMHEDARNLPSVAEICRRTGLNRSTFYAHFDNVEDLIRKHSLRLSDERAGLPEPIRRSFKHPNILPLLQNIQDNADFYQAAAVNNMRSSIEGSSARSLELIDEMIRPIFTSNDEVMLFSEFVGKGFTGVINKWLNGGSTADIARVAYVIETCLIMMNAGAEVMASSTQAG